jgi:hypothetical protein
VTASPATTCAGERIGSGASTTTLALAVTAGRVQTVCAMAANATHAVTSASGIDGSTRMPNAPSNATTATTAARHTTGSRWISRHQTESLLPIVFYSFRGTPLSGPDWLTKTRSRSIDISGD